MGGGTRTCSNSSKTAILDSDVATGFVFVADEGFHAVGIGGMGAFEVLREACLEISGGFRIAQFLEVRHLARGPGVQRDGSYLRYVRAEFAMDATARHADEGAEIG